MSRTSLSDLRARIRARTAAAVRSAADSHSTAMPGPAPTGPAHRGSGSARARQILRAAAHIATVLLILSVPAAAYADTNAAVILAAESPKNLQTVIGNLQTWIMGILAALATLFLVLAGVYWATAGGDPAQVDKAKGALKNALVGYGLAVLAPMLLEIVKGIVGG
jgi:hypothetical protein